MTWRAAVYVADVSGTISPSPFEYSEYTTQVLATSAVTLFWTKFNLARTLNQYYQSQFSPDGGSGKFYIDPHQIVSIRTYVDEI